MRSENSAPTRSAQHLIAASQDEDENVRSAAAKALKRSERRRTTEPGSCRGEELAEHPAFTLCGLHERPVSLF